MELLLWFMLGICLWGMIVSVVSLARLQFAKQVLDELKVKFEAGVISEPQARVLLNDMGNPLDTAAIVEVKRQLDELTERYAAQSTH